VGHTVEEINALAEELALLNRDITAQESGGTVSAPLRDRREAILARLSELTGGTAYPESSGRVSFALPGGTTLVAGIEPLPLATSRAADGTLRIHSGADGTDVTARLTGGRLGSLLAVRDGAIAGHVAALDQLAADIIGRANGLTAAAFDLQGNPGTPLFEPDPPAVPGAAGAIRVAPALVGDATLLAISASGAAGDGSVALALAALPQQASVGLGGKSAASFFSDLLAALGTDVAQADVSEAVSGSILESLESRRDSISGVSLDEEALELMRYQQSFEAAARFIQVLDSVTKTAVDLLGR
jgi:flagellar hook-associated protein 1 FlgK